MVLTKIPDTSWQGDYLPSFGAETNISLHEFPYDCFLVGEQLGITAELLSDESGSSSVIHNCGKGKSKLTRQVLHEACSAGFILAVDTKETVPKDKDFGIWIVMVYREWERYEEAEQLLVPALETNRRLYGGEDQATLRSMVEAAELYRDQGHYEKAEQLLFNAERIAQRVFGNDHEITNASVSNLTKLYEAWNKPEKAEQWRAKLEQIEDHEE